MKKPFTSCILGVNIAVTNMQDTVKLIVENIEELRGEFMCLTNVHTTILAHDSEEYRNVQNAAYLALPDGKPVALVEKLRGHKDAKQVAGPDLMPALWKGTANTGLKHYFYGSTQETIDGLKLKMESEYPDTCVVGLESPPFRTLSPEEDEEMVKRINDLGVDILWVGLGAPKQEEWMYKHKGKINALMLGVGAGFDFHAGTVKRAPNWMRKCYLEWLYRLFQDPKRLMRRYLGTNGKFILLFIRDAFVWKKYTDSSRDNVLIYAKDYDDRIKERVEKLNEKYHVTVITSVPVENGKVQQKYRTHIYHEEKINGIDIVRVRVPEYFKQGKLFNKISDAFYYINAITATMRAEEQKYLYTFESNKGTDLLIKSGKFIKKAECLEEEV